MDLLTFHGVNTLTEAHVEEVTSNVIIIVSKALGRKELDADTIVLAVGMKAREGLYKTLADKIVHLYMLGDCREPRNITGAILDGYERDGTIKSDNDISGYAALYYYK